MTRFACTWLPVRFTAAVSLLVACLSVAPPAQAQAQDIEGAWLMSVTLRNCANNAPLGPAFLTLLTFHAGGTLSESAASAGFAPGQRGPGHGWWRRTGAATFAGQFAALVLFDTPANPPASPGFRAGGVLVNTAFTLTGSDQLTATATASFYDATLAPYRRACPSILGQRLR